MENFFNLRAEKQNHIIDAALAVFGKNGYKKASVNDIATAAGISKAMVFYYFGSKKNLYLYLRDLCVNTMISKVKENFGDSSPDFFDRLRVATEVKMSVLKKHPAMLSFLKSLYTEDDLEVALNLKSLVNDNDSVGSKMMFGGMDVSRFKDGVDPKLLMKFIIWASEGFGSELPVGAGVDEIDGAIEDFYKMFALMKEHFYKDN